MKIIISDTTPLISLLRLDRLDILKKLFGKLIIPEEVFNEINNPSYTDYKVEADKILSSGFIQIDNTITDYDVNTITYSKKLDSGEKSAIALYHKLNADLLLLDEFNARSYAMEKGIKIMGTLGILLTANQKNFLTYHETKECLDYLYYVRKNISKELYENALGKLV